MIATPFGLVSTVGTYQLQATGNMRWLMRLSVMEGLANLAFDLLFVGPLGMGVMGASMGTACANVLRCAATVIILAKATDIYKADGVIKGVCVFCSSLVNVAINGVQGSMLPLMGIIVGAEDWDGLHCPSRRQVYVSTPPSP